MTVRCAIFFIQVLIAAGIGPLKSQPYQLLFDMRVPLAPGILIIDGKPTVYYELQLRSFSNDSIILKSLDIIGAIESSILVSFNSVELKNRYSRIGFTGINNDIVLAPGSAAVVYLEFALPGQVKNTQWKHRFQLEILHGGNRNLFSAEGAATVLANEAALVVGAPLKNGPWAAVYDPSWLRGHRRVVYTVNGKDFIPGRFAIDFIKLDKQGRYAAANEDSIKNWYGYASDVLAVADGRVAAVRDDFPESARMSLHPDYTPDKSGGNYISIKIGDNQFAFYEHLQPGSIRVKPGQHVKKGAVIASLGFTGQSTGPHLHFHIANANAALGADGIPFVFEQFTQLGGYANFESFGKLPWNHVTGAQQVIISKERPAANSVIHF